MWPVSSCGGAGMRPPSPAERMRLAQGLLRTAEDRPGRRTYKTIQEALTVIDEALGIDQPAAGTPGAPPPAANPAPGGARAPIPKYDPVTGRWSDR